MLKIVTRIEAGVLTGLGISFLGFLYMGFMFGFDASVTWGVLLWYTFIGFLIGVVGTVKKHPIFGFHLLYLRGALVAGILNLGMALIAEQEFNHLFSFVPFSIVLAFLLEGIVAGVVIDGIATKIGGEGKELLEKAQPSDMQDSQ